MGKRHSACECAALLQLVPGGCQRGAVQDARNGGGGGAQGCLPDAPPGVSSGAYGTPAGDAGQDTFMMVPQRGAACGIS
jgi:hypothetical protein